jgi:hypothetical protein
MKNRLKSVSEIRTFVEKTLKSYQAKKASLENRTILLIFSFILIIFNYILLFKI